MMRLLVTGGAGFIGSHLVDRLLDCHHQVLTVDNLYSGKLSNVNPSSGFENVDITDYSALERVFERHKPEMVFHLAAQSYVSVSTKQPQVDARINILGSLNLLELSRRFGVGKFIYSNSGGASYGNPLSLPISEEHPISPVCQYGISKHTVEHYLSLYHANFGLPFTSLRYANVYGPRQNPHGEGGVVAIFSDKLLTGERPTIFGDGSQIRDYCHVSDIVDSNLLAMIKLDNDFFNVGTGIGTSTREIFDLIQAETGTSLEPEYASERLGDAKACVLNPLKLQREGWKVNYPLVKGIRETVDYFRKQLNTQQLKP